MNNNSKHSRTSREGIVLMLRRESFVSVFTAGTDGGPAQAGSALLRARTAEQRKGEREYARKTRRFYEGV